MWVCGAGSTKGDWNPRSGGARHGDVTAAKWIDRSIFVGPGPNKKTQPRGTISNQSFACSAPVLSLKARPVQLKGKTNDK